jgi:hypothetical protein
MATPTILQGERVFEINGSPIPFYAPTLLDNNKNVWSNVVLNCDCTSGVLNVNLPSLASLGNTLDFEIIINKVDVSANKVIINGFTDMLGLQDYIGSGTSVSMNKQWQSYILRPASINAWARELSA